MSRLPPLRRVRLFLPAELSQVIHGHSFEQRLIQNNLN